MSSRSATIVVAAMLLAVTTAVVGGCSVPPERAPTDADVITPSGQTVTSSSSLPPEKVFTGSGQEWEQALNECLTEAGWPLVDNGDGTSTWVGSEHDPQGFNDAYAGCEAEVGVPPPPSEISDAQYATMYRYMVETRACLIDLGYTITEPPTVEQWTDDYRASFESHRPPWLPWSEMPPVAPPAAEEQCPQEPDGGWEAYFLQRGVDG